MLSLLTCLLSLVLLAEANIDGLVCSNTSYYGEVEYVDQELSCCTIDIAEPDCTTTQEKACVNVTETVCMVSPLLLLSCVTAHLLFPGLGHH
jgi:hypothetical protein